MAIDTTVDPRLTDEARHLAIWHDLALSQARFHYVAIVGHVGNPSTEASCKAYHCSVGLLLWLSIFIQTLSSSLCCLNSLVLKHRIASATETVVSRGQTFCGRVWPRVTATSSFLQFARSDRGTA